MAKNDTTKGSPDPSNEQQEIHFKYVKSNFFRVIHADGAWGGVSPRGAIHMSFYNERGPLPDSSKLTVGPDGNRLMPEVIENSGAIIREIECDVVFDLQTAISFRTWLDDKIKDLQELIKAIQDDKRKQAEEQRSITSKTG